MKHHDFCREDHEAIERRMSDRLLNTAQTAQTMALMSIANRLAGIEEQLAANLASRGNGDGLAAAVEAELHGGSD